MRLFVAVFPPPEVRDDLASASASWRSATGTGRWVAPEEMHVTVAFIGEADDRTRAKVAAALDETCGMHAAVAVEVAGWDGFPRPARAKVGVFSVRSEGLRRVEASLRAALGAASVPLDPRPFRPHLTAARFTTSVGLSGPPRVPAPAWTAGALTLVRSRLGRLAAGQARYEVLSEHALTGPDGLTGSAGP